MSSAGAWTHHYSALVAAEPYGDDTTYQLAADWTRDCAGVADWGCGKGWLRGFVGPERYRGIDGSWSPFADEVADLTTYRSKSEGIVLRHVLEHEHNWRQVLDNAVCSFTRRLFIALFTPVGDLTHVLRTEPGYHDVPVISFALTDLLGRLPECSVETVPSATEYGAETLIRAER